MDRNELVLDHLGLAEDVAGYFVSCYFPIEDAKQEAVLGLMRAAEEFDKGCGVPFAGFARKVIRWDLISARRDYIRRIRLPHQMVRKVAQYRDAYNKLSDERGRKVLFNEVCEWLGIESRVMRYNLWKALDAQRINEYSSSD